MADIGEILNEEGGGSVRTKLNTIRTYINSLKNLTGLVKVSGESLSAATAGTDYQAPLTKASGTDVDTGTDDAKYVTSKAIADSDVAFKPLQVGSLTLASANWTTGTDFEEYELSNANITADDIVEVIPDNADIDVVAAAEILPATVSAAGAVTIFAKNTPTGDIGVTINITRRQ